MAKFVQFTDTFGKAVFINPDHVTCVIEITVNSKSYFKLYLSTGESDCIEVTESSIEHVIKKLEKV